MKKIILFTLLCSDALNGMDSTPLYELRRIGKKSLASDFEIYQLLSYAAKNNPQLYLPELIEIITITAYEITQERTCKEIEKELKRMRPNLNFLPGNTRGCNNTAVGW